MREEVVDEERKELLMKKKNVRVKGRLWGENYLLVFLLTFKGERKGK